MINRQQGDAGGASLDPRAPASSVYAKASYSEPPPSVLTWVAWNNGGYLASGAGYGLRLSAEDRDKHLSREWKHIYLQFPPGSGLRLIPLHIDKPTFWNSDHRSILTSHEIGKWLRSNGYAHWPKRKPPRVDVLVLGDGYFRIVGVQRDPVGRASR